jgi:hypothetical protein
MTDAPLMAAREDRDEEMERLLVEHGATPLS